MLPFGDGDFGAISGQYIVEYTRKDATLAEASRVLEPRGRVQLILHHADSIVVANARESLSHVTVVTDDEQLIDKAARFFESSTTPGPAAESARLALIESGKRVEAAAEASSNPILLDFVLTSVTSLLEHRARLTPADIAAHIERLAEELKLWRLRLEDLVGAALSDADMHDFVEAAASTGLGDGRYTELEQAGDILVGWLFNASKRV